MSDAASVTRSAGEVYTVVAGHAWAIISVFPFGQKGGGLAILSDYGEWAYGWSHPGPKGFKPFILGLDNSRDYLVRKLTKGRPKHYDHEATVKGVKEMVARRTEEGATVHRWAGGQRVAVPWTQDHADAALRTLEAVSADFGHSADLFLRECFEDSDLAWLSDHAHDLAVMVPGLRRVRRAAVAALRRRGPPRVGRRTAGREPEMNESKPKAAESEADRLRRDNERLRVALSLALGQADALASTIRSGAAAAGAAELICRHAAWGLGEYAVGRAAARWTGLSAPALASLREAHDHIGRALAKAEAEHGRRAAGKAAASAASGGVGEASGDEGVSR